MAQAAWRRGAEVSLVSGPSTLPAPTGVAITRVESAEEMRGAVLAEIGEADVAIFAAAVADFRPQNTSDQKVKRASRADGWSIDLEENPDIAKEAGAAAKPGTLLMGFALETENLLANAREKMEGKGLHMLVANDATHEGAGFEVDTNEVTLLYADRPDEPENLGLRSKAALAEDLIDRIAQRLEGE